MRVQIHTDDDEYSKDQLILYVKLVCSSGILVHSCS